MGEYEVLECDSVECVDKEPHWVIYHIDTGTGVDVFYSEKEAEAETRRLNETEATG